ncbi:nitroreductase [Bradyrhizobium elkanii]|uniref:NAD(P)H-dependent oxidoreductase n=1 Tax=Bradyrhizobium elkanii TaxID=29448 RepID=UPI002167A9A3|nr:NAD(P)H-dependent oxidoreductase [Bradyrhizobium elkanii]MCS3479336.1 nitroreductase [Bradyrhizobium elkanii]
MPTPTSLSSVNSNAAPTFSATQVLGALRWRYATKTFDPARKVSDADLEALLEVIRLAPTSSGMQRFHVTVVSNPSIKEKIREASFGQEQTTMSSHVLVFSARPNFRDHAERLFAAALANGAQPEKVATLRRNTKIGVAIRTLTASREAWAARQAYIALGFALVAAAELAIDACLMEGFLPGKLAKAIHLETTLTPVVMMAIGYRSDADKIRPKYRLSKEKLIRVI